MSIRKNPAVASFRQFVLISCALFAIAAVVDGSPRGSYRVNSKAFRSDTTFQNVFQSPTVSLRASRQPAAEVLKEIAKQSERDVAWRRSFEKGSQDPISLNLQDAPFWVAVAEVCRQVDYPFSIYTQDEYPLNISETGDTRVDAYQVKGPFFFVWSVNKDGGVTCRLLADPGSEARVFEPRADPTFRVTFANGRRVSIEADSETQDGMGGRIWSWKSARAFRGARKARRVEIEIDLLAVAGAREVRFPWKSGQSRRAGTTTVNLGSVKRGTVEDHRPDPPFDRVEFQQYTAELELSNETTKSYERITLANRQPTSDEWGKISGADLEWAGARRAWVVGTRGERIKGELQMVGRTGRFLPYRCEVRAKTLSKTFKPASMLVLCGGRSKQFKTTFTLENVPLSR